MIEEIWKNIDIFPNQIYQISNFGNVRNIITGKFIVGDRNNMGYRRVTLYGNNF